MKRSVKIPLLFVSVGLLFAFCVFFVLFGEGLQLLMPFILFWIFFILQLILGKIPFTRKHPLVRLVISLMLILVCFILI